jgi:hypothetical protein
MSDGMTWRTEGWPWRRTVSTSSSEGLGLIATRSNCTSSRLQAISSASCRYRSRIVMIRRRHANQAPPQHADGPEVTVGAKAYGGK